MSSSGSSAASSLRTCPAHSSLRVAAADLRRTKPGTRSTDADGSPPALRVRLCPHVSGTVSPPHLRSIPVHDL